jgi:hypothetical protein
MGFGRSRGLRVDLVELRHQVEGGGGTTGVGWGWGGVCRGGGNRRKGVHERLLEGRPLATQARQQVCERDKNGVQELLWDCTPAQTRGVLEVCRRIQRGSARVKTPGDTRGLG